MSALCYDVQMRSYHEFSVFRENEILAKTNSDFEDESRIIPILHSRTMDLISTNPIKIDFGPQLHIFAGSTFILRAVNTLRGAWLRAIEGQYVQSVMLLRSAYEDLLAFEWLSDKPTHANRWIQGMLKGINPIGRKPPTAERMRAHLNKRFGTEVGNAMRDFYNLLSAITHGHALGLMWSTGDLVHRGAGTVAARIGPVYEAERTALCLTYIISFSQLFLQRAERLCGDRVTKERLREARAIRQAAETLSNGLYCKYGSRD